MRSNHQGGSALIIGLVFLLILTILGTAGMKMARFQIILAGNEQYFAQAVNAAEAAIEVQIADGSFDVNSTAPSAPLTANTDGVGLGTSKIEYLNKGMAPSGGYSDDILTYRFVIDASGEAPPSPDARANVKMRQGFYVLAPSGGS